MDANPNSCPSQAFKSVGNPLGIAGQFPSLNWKAANSQSMNLCSQSPQPPRQVSKVIVLITICDYILNLRCDTMASMENLHRQPVDACTVLWSVVWQPYHVIEAQCHWFWPSTNTGASSNAANVACLRHRSWW